MPYTDEQRAAISAKMTRELKAKGKSQDQIDAAISKFFRTHDAGERLGKGKAKK